MTFTPHPMTRSTSRLAHGRGRVGDILSGHAPEGQPTRKGGHHEAHVNMRPAVTGGDDFASVIEGGELAGNVGVRLTGAMTLSAPAQPYPNDLSRSIRYVAGTTWYPATRKGGKLVGEFVTDLPAVASSLCGSEKPISRSCSFQEARKGGVTTELPATFFALGGVESRHAVSVRRAETAPCSREVKGVRRYMTCDSRSSDRPECNLSTPHAVLFRQVRSAVQPSALPLPLPCGKASVAKRGCGANLKMKPNATELWLYGFTIAAGAVVGWIVLQILKGLLA